MSRSDSPATTVDNLSLRRNFKLASFHIGSAMADILALSVWNRVAIVELGLAATPIALLLGLRYFLAPLSIWVGQRSDVASWRGYRRLPYIWSGRLMMILSYFLLGLGTVTLADNRTNALGWIGLVAALILFSVGSTFSGTTYLSLIYDITPERQRTRVVSVVWFFLIAGFAGAGILYGKLLPQYSREGFMALFVIAPLIMGALWFFSVWREEKPVTAIQQAAPIEKRPFLQDFKTVWSNTQTRVFFLFLALSTLFFYAQDSILEPFAGQVFGMKLEQTSRFSAYWGSMTLVGIVVSLWLERRFPKTFDNVALSRWGVATLLITFALFFLSAVAQIRGLVTINLILMGIGLGMWTVGTLGLMMDMTRAWGAGLYLALWTVSETLARGVGVIIGGVLRDVTLSISGQLSTAYGAVFFMEAVGFALTLIVLSRVNVHVFQQQTPAPDTVLSAAMD